MKKLAVVLALVGLLLATWPWWRKLLASELMREPSPDGRYAMVVYRFPMLFSSIGGGSDAPGYVQLQDQQGHVLHEADLEMVQLAYGSIRWTTSEVEIPVVAGPWQLP